MKRCDKSDLSSNKRQKYKCDNPQHGEDKYSLWIPIKFWGLNNSNPPTITSPNSVNDPDEVELDEMMEDELNKSVMEDMYIDEETYWKNNEEAMSHIRTTIYCNPDAGQGQPKYTIVK